MKRVLIIEDLPAAREWLAESVHLAFPTSQIDMAADCAGARDALDRQWPGMALIDLGLPDGDGTRLIAWIKSRHPATLCIVASTFADDTHIFPALRAGADGYFTKDQGRAELARLLTEIADGQPPLSPDVARRLMAYFQHEDQPEAPLSERETEVLRLIGKGYSSTEVGRLLGITRNTAAGYVKDIYRKLGISSRAEAALKAAEFGLLR
ncbi:response regulator [Wenzhouxiangella sediminis]|uniref:DNA-binding response regulator n=1 Tax=Wenzhouxiangella sediminis TaxID=1792836 RepID=A0A3E1K9E2_9GAMM|nr:response regulator transcription factor [Wenzhouxiangella sediminis]RFF30772.1 DNA-binding response regulator [Wenzhouxiangella sediminis]